MIDNSRIKIYDFLYSMFYDVVTKNVYKMERPQELTESDINDGFIVLRVGAINDESEFNGNAYIWARVFVEAYIPPKSRGRLDKNKYKVFEDAINIVMNHWDNRIDNNGFSIDIESMISNDNFYAQNKDNVFHMLTKSFLVYQNDSVDSSYRGDLFIGLGENVLESFMSIENLVNLQHYNVDIPNGNYGIQFPETKYLWICTTNEVNKVLSSEIEVPIEEPIFIGNLNCYRSSNAIIEGTMEFQII